MFSTFTHSQSLGNLLVRFARAPLTRLCFPISCFERRPSGLLTPLTLPHPTEMIRSCTTTAGARLAMAQRSEENLDRYRPGGYHFVHLGDVFNDRYVVVRKLGYGQYSTVWLARDTRVNRHVALKILTADSYGGEKDVYELSILRHIKNANPDHPGYKHVVCLLDEFRHAGPHGDHVCLVFEVMGEDLVGLARRYCDGKLPVHLVKQVARQLLLGLDYLHRSCMVVHTDLQPRNIMIQLEDAEVCGTRPPRAATSPAEWLRRRPAFFGLLPQLRSSDNGNPALNF
ncbi:MAG: serine/threonine protein kinase, CMGC group [Candelina submexicana]|nr:MAG: serine/threonine protein kinase, CMGC group [Candelina submexicana]